MPEMYLIGSAAFLLLSVTLFLYFQQRLKAQSAQSLLQNREQELAALKQALEEKNREEVRLQAQLSRLETENQYLNKQQREQQQILHQQQQKLQSDFENFAHRLLQQQSESMSRANQEQLGLLLSPLRERLQSFEKQVQDARTAQASEQGALRNELQKLMELNRQMSEEAQSLTRALQGDSKQQGNWGELILERILESSGLQKGRDYVLQGEGMGLRTEEGRLQKPDVIIHLPEERHLIVDAKVSLTAYERLQRAASEEEQGDCLQQHVISIRSHIKELADKHYARQQKLNSPDFVLLFLPIEASFSLALTAAGHELFEFAWERRVVMVSPTTLLATLRTVASLWKLENQNQNAQHMAQEAGKLYDKLYLSLQSFQELGDRLQKTQHTYQKAMGQLCEGRGNALSLAEKLRDMGATPKHNLQKISTKALKAGVPDQDSAEEQEED